MFELFASLNPVQMVALLLFMILMIAVICTMCKRGGMKSGGRPSGGGDHGGGDHSGGGEGGSVSGGRVKRKSRKGLIMFMVAFTFIPILYIVLTLSFKDYGATLKINDIKTVQERAQKIQGLLAGTAEKMRDVFLKLLEPPK